MRHWAYTLDAARSIVRRKANTMNDQTKYIMAAIVACIVITAIIDLFKLTKEPAKGNAQSIDLAQLPPGSIIVLPKGTE